LRKLRKVVLTFTLKESDSYQRHNFSRRTSVTIPSAFSNGLNDRRTFSSSLVQFNQAKLEKIKSYGPCWLSLARSVNEQISCVTLFSSWCCFTFSASLDCIPTEM